MLQENETVELVNTNDIFINSLLILRIILNLYYRRENELQFMRFVPCLINV